ncbi:MAG TPA: nitronate monooxygenase [Streptosporangiaceae bacterium]|nr:nitronate monooxygenase [Streptosporangiaceae bacterium]
MILSQLHVPIVLAPLAGGPTTPQLAAAVSNAGGLGFLAAGYLSADQLRGQIDQARALTSAPLGVNVFVPGSPSSPAAVAEYARAIAADARGAGVELGTARFDDDDWAAKLALLTANPPTVTSFTFGCPDRDLVKALQAAGSEVWVTVTTPTEAALATVAGADALVVQGSEAGGHRGGFTDDPADDSGGGFGLLSLLQLVRSRTSLSLVAAGGISTGEAIAAVLAAGAAAAQLGTAFLRCPEAGTTPLQRTAVASATSTALTRAFTGRLARGIRNQFLDDHAHHAPAAYPEVHYLTSPVRAAGRSAGNPDLVNLWAGQTHELSRDLPAAELVASLIGDARTALLAAAGRYATNENDLDQGNAQ